MRTHGEVTPAVPPEEYQANPEGTMALEAMEGTPDAIPPEGMVVEKAIGITPMGIPVNCS